MNQPDMPYQFFKPMVMNPHYMQHTYFQHLPYNFYGPQPPYPIQFMRQIQPIVISSDEEEIPKKTEVQKQPKVQVITPPLKKITKVLDLDQLEVQGRLYDCESSAEVIQKPLRNAYYQKKLAKIRKEITKHIIKHIQIGQQQTKYEQSAVNVNLIRVYERNEEKFLQLYNKLKLNYPNANDEDAITILNIAGKNYEKAEMLIDENGSSIQYYLEICKSDDETTNQK